MKDGVLRDDEGFDLLVDGKGRSFRDVYEVALDAARELKRLNRGCRPGVTNIRNANSKQWMQWLGLQNRCVVRRPSVGRRSHISRLSDRHFLTLLKATHSRASFYIGPTR